MKNSMYLPCPMCGGANKRKVIVHLIGSIVVRCGSCLGESVSDVPNNESLANSYVEFEAGRLSRENFEEYTRLAERGLRRVLNACGRGLPSGEKSESFFDYGCGGGHFMSAAENLGFRAVGMDIDRVSIKFAQSQGLDVRFGTLPDYFDKVEDERFDVINVMHVLEHVPNPLEVGRILVKLLKPDGVLIVNVPDQGSFPAAVKKVIRNFGIKRNGWGYVQPPVHLHGFRTATLHAMGISLNLQVRMIKKVSPLDTTDFPTTEQYWKNMRIHRFIYASAQVLGSGGYLCAIYQRVKS